MILFGVLHKPTCKAEISRLPCYVFFSLCVDNKLYWSFHCFLTSPSYFVRWPLWAFLVFYTSQQARMGPGPIWDDMLRDKMSPNGCRFGFPAEIKALLEGFQLILSIYCWYKFGIFDVMDICLVFKLQWDFLHLPLISLILILVWSLQCIVSDAQNEDAMSSTMPDVNTPSSSFINHHLSSINVLDHLLHVIHHWHLEAMKDKYWSWGRNILSFDLLKDGAARKN